ncbi:MAG: prenyltransferase/squalene oxidase repeat-containing protein [Planctomycetota bacterium]|jgi:hypothetical protein
MIRIAVVFMFLSMVYPLEVLGAEPGTEARRKAVARGIQWLCKKQGGNGSWGSQYSVAVTSFACLAHLASSDEPFEGEGGRSLLRGLEFLLSSQKEGVFVDQGHTWIHGQGFASLALSEAAGKALRCKVKPDLDVAKLREVVGKAVKVISIHQSKSGGWWYKRGCPDKHEGSTTCCAVQALVSAANFGVVVDEAALERGFEYLKKCQNPDGGFDYQMGPGTASMREGTAGGVATLGLMKKFDFAVMMKGFEFLKKSGPEVISRGRFPYYGHFYGIMGMRLLGQEMDHLEKDTEAYLLGAVRDLLGWQNKDGSWPVKGWMKSSGGSDAYGTAFGALTLAIPEGRLSIFNRDAPDRVEGE